MDFLSFYWRDVLDIALVTLLLYRILLLIRGTRAFSALIGLVGLVAVYAGGVRLEAWVRLWPDDIEALIRPNYLMRDFRARFRLYVDGEWSNWRLEEVCDYHPSSPSTRCIFTKIV